MASFSGGGYSSTARSMGRTPRNSFFNSELRMPIGIVERCRGVLEGIELAALMGHVGEDKGHCAANRFLPIGDDACDWHLPGLQQVFDLGQQPRQISLRTAE